MALSASFPFDPDSRSCVQVTLVLVPRYPHAHVYFDELHFLLQVNASTCSTLGCVWCGWSNFRQDNLGRGFGGGKLMDETWKCEMSGCMLACLSALVFSRMTLAVDVHERDGGTKTDRLAVFP